MAKSASVALGGWLIQAGDMIAVSARSCHAFPRDLRKRLTSGLIPLPRRYAALEKAIDDAARPYLSALLEKRSRLLVADAHGQVHHDHWAREMGRFLTEMVMPRLGAEAELAWRRLPHVAERLDAMIAAHPRPRI
jgi:hypothetical protein